jgi:hypothetical protein
MEHPYIFYGGMALVGIVLSVSVRPISSSMMKIISSLFFELWVALRVCAMTRTTDQGQGVYPCTDNTYTHVDCCGCSLILVVSSTGLLVACSDHHPRFREKIPVACLSEYTSPLDATFNPKFC